MVPVVGLEPTRYRYQRILSPSRLPIPSHRHVFNDDNIAYPIPKRQAKTDRQYSQQDQETRGIQENELYVMQKKYGKRWEDVCRKKGDVSICTL